MAAEKSQLKAKKKTWYQIFAIKSFGESFIGELPLTEAELMLDRSISMNLMNLTNNPKNQNINLRFKIERVLGSKGMAFPTNYEMISSTIKRLVRRKKDKIDDSFVCTTADGIKVRVKSLILTRYQTKHSVDTLLRKSAREFLTAAVAGSNYFTFFLDIINFRVQRALKDYLKKKYPVAICEIRIFEAAAGQKLSAITEEMKRSNLLMSERRAPESRETAPVSSETKAETSSEPSEEKKQESKEESSEESKEEKSAEDPGEASEESSKEIKPVKKSPKKKKENKE